MQHSQVWLVTSGLRTCYVHVLITMLQFDRSWNSGSFSKIHSITRAHMIGRLTFPAVWNATPAYVVADFASDQKDIGQRPRRHDTMLPAMKHLVGLGSITDQSGDRR